MSDPGMLELVDVCRSFGSRRRRQIVALRRVGLRGEAGEVIGILGPNGAGKTTLLRILAGVLPPDSGSVRVCGGDPLDATGEIRRHVGLLPEEVGLPNRLRVEEYLRAFAGLNGIPRGERSHAARRALDALELLSLKRRKMGSLSHGQRRRVALARCLLHLPDLILLDEPTSGLDIPAARSFRQQIAELSGQGRLLVIATHNGAEAEEVCTRLGILLEGRYRDVGSPREFCNRFQPPWKLCLRFEGKASSVRERVRNRLGGICLWAARGEIHWWSEHLAPEDTRTFPELLDSGAGEFRITETRREGLTLEDAYLIFLRRKTGNEDGNEHPEGGGQR